MGDNSSASGHNPFVRKNIQVVVAANAVVLYANASISHNIASASGCNPFASRYIASVDGQLASAWHDIPIAWVKRVERKGIE